MLWWFHFAGAVVEAFVRLHDKGLIYQGIIICRDHTLDRRVCLHDLFYTVALVYSRYCYHI
jgi:hypothetical protein